MTILKTIGAGPEVGKLFLAVTLLMAASVITGFREPAGSEVQASASPQAGYAIGSTDLYCTQEVKRCPNGTYVGRDSRNNCEFHPCPKSRR